MNNNNPFTEINVIVTMVGNISEDHARKYCAWLHKQYPTGIPVCAVKDDFQQFLAL